MLLIPNNLVIMKFSLTYLYIILRASDMNIAEIEESFIPRKKRHDRILSSE